MSISLSGGDDGQCATQLQESPDDPPIWKAGRKHTCQKTEPQFIGPPEEETVTLFRESFEEDDTDKLWPDMQETYRTALHLSEWELM